MPLSLAVFLGALTPLAFAPFQYFYLVFFTPALLLWVLEKHPSKSFWIGLCFGVGFFGVGASWIYVSIHDYGYASPLLASILTGLFIMLMSMFFAVQLKIYSQWFSKVSVLGQILVYPSLWTLFEWMRGWFLGGFPWLYLGYSQIETPLAQGFAPVGGVFLVSYLVATCSVLLYSIIFKKYRVIPIGVLIILVFTGFLLQSISWTKKNEGAIDVALIQPNIPQGEKWSSSQLQNTLQQNLVLTEPFWGKHLIIWPENAIPLFSDLSQSYLDYLETTAKEHNSFLMTGIPLRDSLASSYYNGILLLGTTGGSYKKHYRVPFGEFVPFEKILRGVITFFDLPMSDFAAGLEHQLPLQAGILKIGPSICYEIAYPQFIATLAKKSNILVTISNDTWFGRSLGPHQHFQIARFRALEVGQYLLRGTNNGITAIIDSHGMVQARISQFEQTTLTGTVYAMTGMTPYVRYQNKLILWVVFFLIGVGFVLSYKARKVHTNTCNGP